MSAASDSDDVSDIFWPGYVDAISNLAINLLFVIAIMAIVVISATLQLQELMKRKDKDPAQVSATTTSAPPAPEALQDIVAKQQKTIAQQAAQIRKLQEDARQAERRASASSAPSRPDSQEPASSPAIAGPNTGASARISISLAIRAGRLSRFSAAASCTPIAVLRSRRPWPLRSWPACEWSDGTSCQRMSSSGRA